MLFRSLVQIGLRKAPDLPDVPLLVDLVPEGIDHEVVRLFSASLELGRVYLAPPNVPAPRVAILRQAFINTVADGYFLDEAHRLGVDVNPTDGETVQKIITSLVAEPPAVVEKARTFLP